MMLYYIELMEKALENDSKIRDDSSRANALFVVVLSYIGDPPMNYFIFDGEEPFKFSGNRLNISYFLCHHINSSYE